MLHRTSFVARRGLAAVAQRPRDIPLQTSTAPTIGALEVQTTRMSNGLLVVSVEDGRPLSRVGLGFRAGARYESASEKGLSQWLRNSVGMGTTRSVGAADFLWSVGSVGAALSATTTRDNFIYEMDISRDFTPEAALILADAAFGYQGHRQWEMKRQMPDWVRLEQHALERQTPELRLVDLAHRAAFGELGLGNSLYLSRDKEPPTRDQFMAFIDANMLTGQAALVGVNADHNFLVDATQDVIMREGVGLPPPQSRFCGGREVRADGHGPFAWMAFVTGAPGLDDSAGAATYSLLGTLLAFPSSVHCSNNYGSGFACEVPPSDRFGIRRNRFEAAATASGDLPAGVASLYAPYSDAGLFGLLVTSHADRANSVARAVIDSVRKLAATPITDDQLLRAKSKLKAEVYFRTESGQWVMEDSIAQMLATGSVKHPAEIAKTIDGVTAADLQAAAKRMVSTKFSMAALGKLHDVPYIDQLLS